MECAASGVLRHHFICRNECLFQAAPTIAQMALGDAQPSDGEQTVPQHLHVCPKPLIT